MGFEVRRCPMSHILEKHELSRFDWHVDFQIHFAVPDRLGVSQHGYEHNLQGVCPRARREACGGENVVLALGRKGKQSQGPWG